GSPDQRMFRREVGVDARERAEALRGLQLRLRPAFHITRAVAVLHGLLQEQLVLDQRTAGLDARGEAGDADDRQRLAAFRTERRLEAVDAGLPLIGGAPRAVVPYETRR